MQFRTFRLAPLALALALGPGWAAAQSSYGTSPSSSNTGSSVTGGKSAPAVQAGTGTRNAETNKDDKVARADRKFMDEAAGGGMFEVEAGKLAQSKGSSPDVKNFGKTLVDDHSAANNELIQLANSRKVELPASPPHGDRRELEKLGKLSGEQFDKEFAKVAVKDHKKDIKSFESASGKAKDPELKAWIDKTLPHLREHLAAAEKLQGGGKNDAAAMGNRGADMPKRNNSNKAGG